MATAADAPVQRRGDLPALAGYWALLVVAIVPLLIDLRNYDETYNGIKARNLVAMAAVIVIALLARRFRPFTPLDRPLLVYAGAIVAATALSVDPRWSIWGDPQGYEGTLSLLAYAAVAAGAARLTTRQIPLLLKVLLAAGVLSAGYGIAQFLGFDFLLRDPTRASWTRAFGTTSGPNWLGGYMLMLIPIASAFALQARSTLAALPYLAAAPILFGALLATESRSAWAGVLVAAVAGTIVWRQSRRTIPAPALVRASVTAAILLALAVLFFFPGGLVSSRGERGGPAGRLTDISDDPGGIQTRIALWVPTTQLIARRPVFGYGPDTFRKVFPQTWTPQWQRLKGAKPLIINRAHNQLLDLAISIGLVGLAGYLWAFIAFWRSATTAPAADRTTALLLAGCAGAVTGYLAQIQWQFSVVSVAPVYWLLLGVGSALARGNEERG